MLTHSLTHYSLTHSLAAHHLKVTECVRAAEEDKLMRECTFHPETHEAPAYVTRIAKSMALAKAGREPDAPERPGWR